MILGICGRKEHGKDTFADILMAAAPGYERLAFARRLKDMCVAVFGLSEAQVSDKMGKETPLPEPVMLDSLLYQMREWSRLAGIREHGLVAKTPRQILQFVGTEYIREADPNYWVDWVADRLARLGPSGDAVITDVRFPNEADMIRHAGGKVLRVLRLAKEMEGAAAPEHPSEALDFKPDYTIALTEGDFSLPRIVCGAVRKGALDDALKAFDWDWLVYSAPMARAYYHDIWNQMCEVLAQQLDPKAEKA
jgi:hypothetical protein